MTDSMMPSKIKLGSYFLSLGLWWCIPSYATDVQPTTVSSPTVSANPKHGLNTAFLIESARADEDEGGGRDDDEGSERIAPVNNPTYLRECGACHFAYQPGLLPKSSWELLMTTLDDHFGDNAGLAPEDQKTLTDYLVNHATPIGTSAARQRSLSGRKVPLRISEMPQIAHAHHKLSGKHVSDNPKVRSISYCDKCHTQASKGSYSEDEVEIPGYGRWD